MAAMLLAPALARAEAPPPPGWDRLKSLIGAWEGTAQEHGKTTPTRTSFRMTGGGSAILNILDEGTPHEMVTMIHPDGKDLMVTHYCAAKNQPRMRAQASKAPNQFTFEFTDGTNIGPGDGHMQRVTFTLVDADHHTQEWTFRDKDKLTEAKFEFHRKK